MAVIPDEIDGVTIQFSAAANNDVTDEMLKAIEWTIVSSVNGETIDRLWVSSVRDRHRCPSRHVTGNAVDISRINGKKIVLFYHSNEAVRRIVDGLQGRFENAPARRENLGPTIKKKEGVDVNVKGHDDHFHWSVNGDHSACMPALWERFKSWKRGTTRITQDGEEVCGI